MARATDEIVVAGKLRKKEVVVNPLSSYVANLVKD